MFSTMIRGAALMLAVYVLSLTAVRAEEADKAEGTIVELAVKGKFTKLVAAVKAAELAETLSGKGPFTVFAPTDKAFEALGEEKLAALLKDKEALKKILLYHVIAGEVPAKAAIGLAKDSKSAKTVEGSEVKLTLDGKSLKLNGTAKVVKADIKASNGIIHVIDAVIVPPTK